jgi:uncharacterized cofD-like protein
VRTAAQELPAHPRRVVALGGGTGLPAVLRGLRGLVSRGAICELTAIVAMSDDGGSSGRLRRSRGIPPPGDVRNCLVALAESEALLAALFQHRYDGRRGLGGHTLGNLILAALAEQTGSFLRAVEVSSQVLRTAGRILPVTLENVRLEAELVDGSRITGESAIDRSRRRVERVALVPGDARAAPGVIEAITAADLVVLGPGSLFTSVVPALVLEEVAAALRTTRALRVLVGNLVTEGAATGGMGLSDHVLAIELAARGPVIDALLAHEGPIDATLLERYRAEGAAPLSLDAAELDGVALVRRPLIAQGEKLRHDPEATAAGLIDIWREHRVPAAVEE